MTALALYARRTVVASIALCALAGCADTTEPTTDLGFEDAIGAKAASGQVTDLLAEAKSLASQYTADKGELPSGEDLKAYGLDLKTGDGVDVFVEEGLGYCISAWNDYAPTAPGPDAAFRYDSVTLDTVKPGAAANPKGVCAKDAQTQGPDEVISAD